MEKEGVIERIHNPAESSTFTFRFKVVEPIVSIRDMAVSEAMKQKASKKRIMSKGEYVYAQCIQVGLGLSVSGLLLLTFFAFAISVGIFLYYVLCFGMWGAAFGTLFALTPAVLTYYLGKWTQGAIQRFEKMDSGVPLTRAIIADLPAADSLVRASAEPSQAQQCVLLRAARETTEGHEEELLRASVGGRE